MINCQFKHHRKDVPKQDRKLIIFFFSANLPAETRLPLLAMISWFLLSMLESLLMRGAQISVRSTAMSPVLRVVVIFDCAEGKRETVR